MSSRATFQQSLLICETSTVPVLGGPPEEMVVKNRRGTVVYLCESCGFGYSHLEIAEQCEEHCSTHESRLDSDQQESDIHAAQPATVLCEKLTVN